MTDPLRPLGHTPRRAEPLQPDKPGSGDATEGASQETTAEDETTKAKEQSSTATSNVRDGYK